MNLTQASYPPIYADPPKSRAAAPGPLVAVSARDPQGLLRVTDEQLLLYANARLTREKPKWPAVVISPSQLGTYDRCNRRWAWETIAGFRSPPTKSQLLGIRVHAVFEAWLKHGTPPDRSTLEGRIALKGIHHLPPPRVGEVERQFYLTTRSGLHFTGIADWLGWHDEVGAIVIDHKSTASLKWAKTKEELEFDVQALLYAIFACISMQTSQVTLRWNYVQTDAKAARLVESTLHLAQIIERFPIVETRAAEMTQHRLAKTHPLRVLPNPNACGDYGGCPHQERCNLSPVEKMEAIMSNETNGTMRDAMTQLTNYTQQQPPQGLPQSGYAPPILAPGSAAAGAPGTIAQYLPPGPTQLHAAPQQFAPAPAQQFTPAPQQAAAPVQPQLAPYHLDPVSGWLVDTQTHQILPAGHPAYADYTARLNAQQQVPVGSPYQTPFAAPTQPLQQLAPQPQQPQQQYPNYSPHSGPNGPEQHADPAQIPAHIATPALTVAGTEEGPKRRGRKTKAEKEAEAAATGGSLTLSSVSDGEQMAFIEAVSGALSNPQLNLSTVTAEQLAYIGDLARAAFKKSFSITILA